MRPNPAIGSLTMVERAVLAGGRCEIESEPGNGTVGARVAVSPRVTPPFGRVPNREGGAVRAQRRRVHPVTGPALPGLRRVGRSPRPAGLLLPRDAGLAAVRPGSTGGGRRARPVDRRRSSGDGPVESAARTCNR